MTTLALPNQKEITEKFSAAKIIFEEILEAEQSLARNRDKLLVLGFKLGRVLADLKDEVGHGKWLTWLEGHWPQLGERNAQRCIALFRSNDALGRRKSVDSSDLDVDSVRKFMWGYIPAKERPQLPGNEEVNPQPHYLTFVNHYSKFRRQASLGRVTLPPLPIMRRDFEPTVRDMIELLGRDWFLELLE